MSTVTQEDLPEDVTLGQACARLGEILGTSEPVSEQVLAAAMQDQAYARNLLVTRDAPELREHLLANPPAVRDDASTVVLTGRVTKALVRWARTGFSTVEEQVYRERRAACAACPHQIEAKRHPTLHRMMADGESPKVCGRCGCSLTRKARMSSERCPDEDPRRPGFNRWGQPHEQA